MVGRTVLQHHTWLPWFLPKACSWDLGRTAHPMPYRVSLSDLGSFDIFTTGSHSFITVSRDWKVVCQEAIYRKRKVAV